MTKTMNDAVTAGDPGRVRLSLDRLRRLEPWLFARGMGTWLAWPGTRRARGYWRDHIPEHLEHGDSRAALVIQLDPLIVSSYNDEIDCVVPLAFPAEAAWGLELTPGTRLLGVCTFGNAAAMMPDLIAGERDCGRYQNVAPYIAEFLSDDVERITARKAEISADEWTRCAELTRAYQARFGTLCRSGLPTRAHIPAQVALQG